MTDTQPTAEQLRALCEKVAAEWADRGKLIEGGWMAFVLTSGLTTAPETQRQQMRKAFFLGAQHLYASIMDVMDAGEEPTDQDMRRMELIHRELEAFRLSAGELTEGPRR